MTCRPPARNRWRGRAAHNCGERTSWQPSNTGTSAHLSALTVVTRFSVGVEHEVRLDDVAAPKAVVEIDQGPRPKIAAVQPKCRSAQCCTLRRSRAARKPRRVFITTTTTKKRKEKQMCVPGGGGRGGGRCVTHPLNMMLLLRTVRAVLAWNQHDDCFSKWPTNSVDRMLLCQRCEQKGFHVHLS